MTKPIIRLLQLYPRDMNIYGDWGNTLVLKKRLEWHGYGVELLEYNLGDDFPENIDLIVGGGGQDSAQTEIQADLLLISPKLHELANDNVPMLMVCGLYQLFGKYFKTGNGEKIIGIGLFNTATVAGAERLTGNTVIESEEFGVIVGYENHSGKTYLSAESTPLGTVQKGAGNNGEDDQEGCRYKNVIGTYLHGSLLPKNPAIADFLIEKAILRHTTDIDLTVIDDRFAELAREVALKRPR